jgi:hypothetical protein
MATHANAGKSTRFRPALKSRSKAPNKVPRAPPTPGWKCTHSPRRLSTDSAPGDHIIVLTWFHRARRDVLKVHPRSDPRRQLTGVFATRSPDRPNPVGLHHVTVRKFDKNRLLIGPIEAIDGTPVIDIKPVLPCHPDF